MVGKRGLFESPWSSTPTRRPALLTRYHHVRATTMGRRLVYSWTFAKRRSPLSPSTGRLRHDTSFRHPLTTSEAPFLSLFRITSEDSSWWGQKGSNWTFLLKIKKINFPRKITLIGAIKIYLIILWHHPLPRHHPRTFFLPLFSYRRPPSIV